MSWPPSWYRNPSASNMSSALKTSASATSSTPQIFTIFLSLISTVLAPTASSLRFFSSHHDKNRPLSFNNSHLVLSFSGSKTKNLEILWTFSNLVPVGNFFIFLFFSEFSLFCCQIWVFFHRCYSCSSCSRCVHGSVLKCTIIVGVFNFFFLAPCNNFGLFWERGLCINVQNVQQCASFPKFHKLK